MKITKKHSNIIPSAHESDEELAPANISSLMMTASTSAHKRANGISFQVVLLDIVSALTLAVSHRIRRILAILDQMIFPMTMSFASLTLPIILTTSSGADVPNATIVSPITRSDIRSFLASEDAPSTRKSAPLMRRINHTTISIYGRIYIISELASKRSS
jgi:hypothetical protein